MKKKTSIEIANGDIKVSQNGDMSQMGGYISTLENEFDDVTVFRWATSSNHVISFWVKEYVGFEYSKEKIFRATTNTIPNNSIVYLPYTIVAFFAKWFCIRPVYEFLMMLLKEILLMEIIKRELALSIAEMIVLLNYLRY